MRAVLALALLAACGADTIAIEDYNQALARAACEQETRCGLFDTVERCMAYKHPLGPITPSIISAASSGNVTYDPVQAAQCVAEVASRSCSYSAIEWRLGQTTVCRGVLRSDRLLGGPCFINEECASRNCASQTTPLMCSIGLCVEPEHVAAPGEDCTQIACSPDSWCAPGINTCVPHLPQGTACFATGQCAFGLDCFDTCEPPPQIGDPCPTFEGTPTCGVTAGMKCNLATGACAAPLHEGDICDPDNDLCAIGYLTCSPDRHRCEQFPAVGQPCGGSPFFHCTAGAICAFSGEGSPGVCVPLVDDGSPCSGQDQLCASGVCDFTTETCVEPTVCV
jgi:hypothetical protein